jgi:hypothetical protein
MDAERIENENATGEEKLDKVSNEQVIVPQNEEEETVASIESNPIEQEKKEPIETEPDIIESKPTETEFVSESVDNLPEKKKEKTDSDIEQLDKEQIIEKLSILVQEDISEGSKTGVEALKQAFYKIKRVETDAAKKAFVEAGNPEADFKSEEDSFETKLKELLGIFKEKRATQTAEIEKIKEENLEVKKAIIERLKELIEKNDDFYKIYNEFRKLQQQWKEVKLIPQSAANNLWKEYQLYSEKFYDLLKINNEMRDYDFKKNMELKQALCVAVEKLDEEKDIVSAFFQLQKFHQEWRETGPVAREFREEIWERFKKASTVINKKHQSYFEDLRSLEQRNLEEKTSLCEEIENIDYAQLNNFKEWNKQNKKVLDIQEKWKTIGFAPKKHNVKIFDRFRLACDVFFTKKSEFYKEVKDSIELNLEKKSALCEQAEALKDSQDWKEATNKLIALQKEWKTIGPVARKHSEAIWKRFISACDYFFEQKNNHFSSQKTEEVENLKKKKEIIADIDALEEAIPAPEAISKIREYIAEFNRIGFVPFKEKDKVYDEFREAVDKQFDRLKVDESERRLQSFRSNVNDLASGGKSKNRLYSERERLMRNYERLRGDIQTYENNIGFLSASSKGGSGLIKEMQRKIESLKEELKLIEKKIEVIDQNLESEN